MRLAVVLAWVIGTSAGATSPAAAQSVARASTAASASIVAAEAPARLLPPSRRTEPTDAVDGKGRNLSVYHPDRVTLHGATGADDVSARASLRVDDAGVARLALTFDRSTAGAYAGRLPLTLAYN